MKRVNLAFETLETADKRAAHEEAQRAAARPKHSKRGRQSQSADRRRGKRSKHDKTG